MEFRNTNQESLNIIDITIQREKSSRNKTVKLSLKNSKSALPWNTWCLSLNLDWRQIFLYFFFCSLFFSLPLMYPKTPLFIALFHAQNRSSAKRVTVNFSCQSLSFVTTTAISFCSKVAASEPWVRNTFSPWIKAATSFFSML